MQQGGNVWIEVGHLVAAVDQLIGEGGLDGVQHLQSKKRIVKNGNMYATEDADLDESEIADRIARLLFAPVCHVKSTESKEKCDEDFLSLCSTEMPF